MPTRYTPTVEELARLANDFTYHPPLPGQQERYLLLRGLARDFGKGVLQCCPPSRERALAMTKLEEAIFWANASIARNEKAANEEPAPTGLNPGPQP